jgi:hypothetical protein
MAHIPLSLAIMGVGGLLGAASAAKQLTSKGGKAPASVSPLPVPTINMAAEAARRDDELRRRRGAGANELTGGGAEAMTAGGKTLLGQ